jgi:hypothetical protein
VASEIRVDSVMESGSEWGGRATEASRCRRKLLVVCGDVANDVIVQAGGGGGGRGRRHWVESQVFLVVAVAKYI